MFWRFPTLELRSIIGRPGMRVVGPALAGDQFPSLPALMPWVSRA
jgi:hypothetical protein